jgi:hypothetical protein
MKCAEFSTEDDPSSARRINGPIEAPLVLNYLDSYYLTVHCRYPRASATFTETKHTCEFVS